MSSKNSEYVFYKRVKGFGFYEMDDKDHAQYLRFAQGEYYIIQTNVISQEVEYHYHLLFKNDLYEGIYILDNKPEPKFV